MAVSNQTRMRVPLFKPDMPPFEEVAQPLREIFESGRVTNFGYYLNQLEQEASGYLGVPVATVSSGTMALIFALQGLGVGPGQKVIVPSFTFMATAQAVLYCGGVPLFAEIKPDLTLDESDLERLLAQHPDVAAVVPVHTYGLPCNVRAIQDVVSQSSIGRARPIPIVYDAAHALGSAIDGARVGGFGQAETFSLSVTKVMTSVEGGMVASRDEGLLRRVRVSRNYGIGANYDTTGPGLNGKLSEIHALIGLHNLRRVPQLLNDRQARARCYRAMIEERTSFRVTPAPPNVVHTFKDFTIIVPAGLKDRRSHIMQTLAERGIETRAYFWPPVHEQTFFRRFADRSLPVTEDLARRVITLPFYSTITEPEMDYVADSLAQAEREMNGMASIRDGREPA